MVVMLEDASTGDRKPLVVGWNRTFFFFSSFLGIPLFRKGLTAWGALIVILWSLDLALPLIMPATTQVVTLSLVPGAVIAVLSVFLAYKGNGLIARKYLVHRRRRMIHQNRLQEFENICRFHIFVNAPNESVH